MLPSPPFYKSLQTTLLMSDSDQMVHGMLGAKDSLLYNTLYNIGAENFLLSAHSMRVGPRACFRIFSASSAFFRAFSSISLFLWALVSSDNPAGGWWWELERQQTQSCSRALSKCGEAVLTLLACARVHARMDGIGRWRWGWRARTRRPDDVLDLPGLDLPAALSIACHSQKKHQ